VIKMGLADSSMLLCADEPSAQRRRARDVGGRIGHPGQTLRETTSFTSTAVARIREAYPFLPPSKSNTTRSAGSPTRSA